MSKYCLINIERLLINVAFWNVTRTILFGMKQERTFFEMGTSSSNIPNVFEGSPLTGHSAYWESPRIFITFFNISTFTSHIQRFLTEITNSCGFAEIFISLKWVFFLPGPEAKTTKDTYIYRVSWVLPNPVFGTDKLIVNTWFT